MIGSDWKVRDTMCILNQEYPYGLTKIISVSDKYVCCDNQTFRKIDGKQVSPGRPSDIWSVRIATKEDKEFLKNVVLTNKIADAIRLPRGGVPFPTEFLQMIENLINTYYKTGEQ